MDYSQDPLLEGLDVYEVGGAVRDRLLGEPVSDRDFVIVGLQEDELENEMEEKRGFEKVGKSFAVYLHPETGDEFAIARTESKSGEGYYGFDWEITGSLKEDLRRRDLTINAMACDLHTGKLIDPFGGQDDLQRELLRHVSVKFKEDPVRALRLARFAGRFGFQVYSGTEELAREVVSELGCVPNERINKELRKSFQEAKDIRKVFHTLDRVGVIEEVFPELDAMKDVPTGPREFHKEGDTFNHTIMVMDEILAKAYWENEYVNGTYDLAKLGYMALAHDLGKLDTDEREYPNHRGHDKAGVEYAEKLSNRLKVSNDIKQAMIDASKYHIKIDKLFEMSESKAIRMVQVFERGNHPDMEYILLLLKADHEGRIPISEASYDFYEALEYIKTVKEIIDEIDGYYIQEKWPDAEGEKIGDLLLQERVEELKERRNNG